MGRSFCARISGLPDNQGGLTSAAIAEKRTINVGNVHNDPRYLTALGTSRSEIIVPILSDQGEVVGTVDVESEQPNAFDQKM